MDNEQHEKDYAELLRRAKEENDAVLVARAEVIRALHEAVDYCQSQGIDEHLVCIEDFIGLTLTWFMEHEAEKVMKQRAKSAPNN